MRRFGYGVLKSKSSRLAHFPVAGNDIFTAEGGRSSTAAFRRRVRSSPPNPARPSSSATPKRPCSAEVNPEGKATTFHFEYISDADFIANANSFSGAHPAKETDESESIGADFKLHNAEAQAALVPETKYHCRVVATNADVPLALTGEEGTFTSEAPLELGATYASASAAEAATLNAEVNPLGISTTASSNTSTKPPTKDIAELGPSTASTTPPKSLTSAAEADRLRSRRKPRVRLSPSLGPYPRHRLSLPDRRHRHHDRPKERSPAPTTAFAPSAPAAGGLARRPRL